MGKVCFGVDVGGTTIKIGLFAEQGDLLDKWEIKTVPEVREDTKSHQILIDVAASVAEKCRERDIATEDILGIGVGIPGPILADGTVIKTANLGWGIFNIKDELRQLTGVDRIEVTNDANVAALGEMWKGGGKGYKNLILITLGTGIGGGVVVDGKIVNGATGAAGEIGHIKVKTDETVPCGCGRKGCLEQYVAAAGIVRCARRKLEESDEPSILRGVSPLTTREIFDGAKAGDAVSAAVTEEFGDIMGLACAQMATILNPEVFVIGGGVSKAGPMIIDLIRKYFVPRVMAALTDTKFVMASLGNDAGIYGAAKMVIKE
ncbi:ROK family glucokinase [Anaerolentibacter hominis]|uniref:ROK family glucokinase n=1 Tax=Anaerolentibacter hominis TaxID=3079009 RepID=UPI0031B8239A